MSRQGGRSGGQKRRFGFSRLPLRVRVGSGGRGSKVHVLLAARVGLRINASKTKVLSANLGPLVQQVINVGDEPLREVLSFKYLGASFTATVQAFGEIKARINVAQAAFNRLQLLRPFRYLKMDSQQASSRFLKTTSESELLTNGGNLFHGSTICTEIAAFGRAK